MEQWDQAFVSSDCVLVLYLMSVVQNRTGAEHIQTGLGTEPSVLHPQPFPQMKKLNFQQPEGLINSQHKGAVWPL